MTNLSTLLTLADSRLPTGGHVHSGGVEEAVTSGLVVDLVTLRAYLRRRIRTHGLVTASLATAVQAGLLAISDADRETHARTPAPAARQASRTQGRASFGWHAGCGPTMIGSRSGRRLISVSRQARWVRRAG